MKKVNQELSPKIKAPKVKAFEDSLRNRVIGQDEAIEVSVAIYQEYLAGINRPNHPIANVILLGPTGTGKTRLVEAWAETLYNNSKAMLKIDCGEYQHDQHLERWLGSPPGYIGHKETIPVFSQETLNKYHNKEHQISLVLFDEIEKAHDSMYQMMLGILDKAELTLGNNKVTDFSKSLIFMTSNLGAQEMNDLAGDAFGFSGAKVETDHSKIKDTAVSALKRKFSPEFVNRIDRTVVFNVLSKEHINTIVDVELGSIQTRLLDSKVPFVFTLTREAKNAIIDEGYDPKNNARELKRVLELNVTQPMASMVVSGQVESFDFLNIDHDGTNFRYHKKGTNCFIPNVIQYGAKAVGRQ